MGCADLTVGWDVIATDSSNFGILSSCSSIVIQKVDFSPLLSPVSIPGWGWKDFCRPSGVKGNYETDLFGPLFKEIEAVSSISYGQEDRTDTSSGNRRPRPSGDVFDQRWSPPLQRRKEYVLRRIMRGAMRHGKILGIEGPFLYRTSSKVVDLMKGAYPELRETEGFISKVIQNEEDVSLKPSIQV